MIEQLRVEQWEMVWAEGRTHELRSNYVERFWLPVLGPTATLLLRRLAYELDRHPEGFELVTNDMACSLGLGGAMGRHGPFPRAVQRCIDFGAAQWKKIDVLSVRLRLPPLNRTQIERLPIGLAEAHGRLLQHSH
jgi:hypothetical protein